MLNKSHQRQKDKRPSSSKQFLFQPALLPDCIVAHVVIPYLLPVFRENDCQKELEKAIQVLTSCKSWKSLLLQSMGVNKEPKQVRQNCIRFLCYPYDRDGMLRKKGISDNMILWHWDQKISCGSKIQYGHDFDWFCNAMNRFCFLEKKKTHLKINQEEALKSSSRQGCLDVVHLLIERKIDLHLQDDYALVYASDNGHLPVVTFLIEKKANLHAQDDMLFDTQVKKDTCRW